jgi:hypothetical protein
MVAEDSAAIETEALAAMERLNASLVGLGIRYKLALVDPKELVPLDKNAHFMRHEMFKNLVENVKRDGSLASIPFCWKNPEDGKYHTLSGNHRVKSAIQAGVGRILILYDDRPLTRQERVAIQLSHNAINGQDDPALLKELWAEIDDLALKYYAGLDDKSLKTLADASLKAMSEAALEYKVVTFLFLPEETEALEAAFQRAAERVSCEESHLLPDRAFAKLVDALDKTKASWNTKNSAVGFNLVLRVFENHLTDLAAGWLGNDDEGNPALKAQPHQKVPIESLFGTNKVPARLGLLLKRCLDKASAEGKASKLESWRVLEEMAGAYLSSQPAKTA